MKSAGALQEGIVNVRIVKSLLQHVAIKGAY